MAPPSPAQAPTNELSSGGGASGDVPRAIRNRLATGEPRALRRPVDLGAELMGAIPAGEDKKVGAVVAVRGATSRGQFNGCSDACMGGSNVGACGGTPH